jgi:hypothetical protein
MRMGARVSSFLVLGIFIALLFIAPARGALPVQSDSDFDHGFIAYSKTVPTDAVARLQKRIDSGELELQSDSKLGYLPAILRELNVPISSQSLVFSKTSFQFTQIAPSRPRALYFNDEVYVGHVQGSRLLELASVDPKLGAVFYTLDEDEKGPPKFKREVYFCLICHDTSAITGGVPGFMTLSVLPDKEGNAIRSAPANAMSDQTPFSERWGGWYVTGTHGAQLHRGNTIFPSGIPNLPRTDWSKGANVTKLDGHIETSDFLTPTSDIVALIALTHQTRIHNLITRANYETQRALHDEERVAGILDPGGNYSAVTKERIRSAVDPLLYGMFFFREAPLTDPIQGVSGFAAEFEKTGIRDRKGRSLKDLDLKRRFLRYPLSYLIYSAAFDALPDPAKAYFYEREPFSRVRTRRPSATSAPKTVMRFARSFWIRNRTLLVELAIPRPNCFLLLRGRLPKAIRAIRAEAVSALKPALDLASQDRLEW